MLVRQPRLLLTISLITSLFICLACTQASNAARSHVPTAVAPPATLVKDIDTAAPTGGDSKPAEFTAVGNTVFFVAEDSTNARELWKTDGTQAGTMLVRDLTPGAYVPQGPYSLTAFNNALFFATSVEYGPTTLWRSDGTATGTVPVTTMSNDIDSIS